MKGFEKNCKCPKCGEKERIRTRWFPKRRYSRIRRAYNWLMTGFFHSPVLHHNFSNRVIFSDEMKEHMARLCGDCGAIWAEIPLDSAAPLIQLAKAAD